MRKKKISKAISIFLLTSSLLYAETSDNNNNSDDSQEFKDLLTEYYQNCQPKGDFYSDAHRGWFYKEYCENLKEKIDQAQKNTQQKPQAKKKQQNQYTKKQKTPTEKTPVEIIKENMDNPEFWKNNPNVWKWLKDDKILSQIDQKAFREVMDKVIYYSALDSNNEEKISTAVYMIDFSRRMSMNFAKGYTQYIVQNQQFNLVNRGGDSSWSYRQTQKIKGEKLKRFIEERLNKFGLMFFGEADCPYCQEQVSILGYLKEKYPNLYIYAVTKNPNECQFFIMSYPNIFNRCSQAPQAFEKFNIQIYPTMFLYYEYAGKKEVVPITAGLEQLNNVESAIIDALYRIEYGRPFNPAEFY
jgi:thiol-disulfide isomerase/thioredoxin